MFAAARVARALEEKLELFQLGSQESQRLLDQYLAALDGLSGISSGELEQRLTQELWPGARATRELDERRFVIPFEHRWETAQEARSWALERLRGVPTVAVDGSQIAASKEFAVPVSLVQVAWFENHHDPAQPYLKDLRNEVITPEPGAAEVEEYAFAESKLNQRRFALEMEIAAERMRELDPSQVPVVFVDGTLVLSFICRLLPRAREAYLQALFSVLDASRELRVPVVGYVDLSFASDFTYMLRLACDLPAGNIFDSRLLAQHMTYFDRTAALQCARGDVLPEYRVGDKDFSRELCFVYLKTGQNRLPARIDFPRWIMDEGLLDRVLDTIRAEVIVGSGYPYALETADAAAVLTTEDRMAFYRLFQQFARDSGLPFSLPGKSLSKAHRR